MSYENIDATFDKLLRKHKTIIEGIEKNPALILDQLWTQHFNNDKFCSVKFQRHSLHYHACKSCFMLSKHFDLTCNTSFVIEYGKRANETFIVRPRVGVPWYRIRGDYIQCDPITCEILIRMIIQDKYEAVGTIITAFKCRYQSYILEEACSTYDKIDYIDNDGIIDLLKQCISLLVWLEDYGFSHTSLDPYHILVHGSDIGFAIDGHSSIKLGKYTICSTTPYGVSNEIEVPNTTLAGIKTFQMSRKIHNSRKCGVAIFGCCVDLYTLIIGLMCDQNIYTVMMRRYKNFWKNLWVTTEDQEKIQEWLADRIGKLPHIDEIVNLLDGCFLRCDALQIASQTYISI